VYRGKTVLAGNAALMEENGFSVPEIPSAGTVVHVAADGRYLGHLIISDTVKKSAAGAVARLRELGIRTVMLTGDNVRTAAAVAGELGISDYRAGLLPEDKVAAVEELLAGQAEGKRLAFAGDGVNDAPVIMRSDVGIAMGALGSDAAIEAADIVLTDDDPAKIPAAVSISRKCMRIVRQNIVFAIGVKLAVLVLAACGLATRGMALLADVGVTLLAVLNAMRALR
jgi:Cd2+/Zn2+-exporting ATPase